MRRGLVFGKFMPLHRGHQLLIDTALSQCDDLTILVYDSVPAGDYPPMPLKTRLDWIRDLYPTVENIVGIPDVIRDGHGDDPKYASAYASELGFLGKFDRVFTSEPQYEDFAHELGATHIVVDAARTLVPTSGTTIRSDLYDYRGWMDPIVYSSLITKVVFVGTESAGKTTLARAMAERYDTQWVHEFGRELWESQDLQGSFADHLKMATRQLERERAQARHARRYLFCDTNAWTTLQWCLRSYGVADPRLHHLVDETINDYVWIICGNDFGWIQDGTRELEGDLSRQFHKQQEDDLRRRGVTYWYALGSLEERIETVTEALVWVYTQSGRESASGLAATVSPPA